jgi:predicted dehydrogenase
MQKSDRRFTRRVWIRGAGGATAFAGPLPAATVRLPRKIRIGIIGTEGHTGDILKSLDLLPDVEVAAISDPSSKALDVLAKDPRVAPAKRYADYRRMLDSEKLDIAGVCNDNGGRAGAILACTERKIHVVAEKPLAIDRPSLARVRQSVERNRVRLGMLLPMRYEPVLALKKIVTSGEIGEIVQISAQKSYKAGERPEWMRKRSSYGGTIPWIGSHMVDLMRWTSGRELTEAFSYQTRIGFPEIGDMENCTATLFRLDNGGMATLRMDYLRPETAPTHGDDRLRLAGTKGIAEYQAATGVTLLAAGRKPEVIRELPERRFLFAEFVDFVYNGRPTGLELSDIFRICEIVLAARESAEKQRPVRL